MQGGAFGHLKSKARDKCLAPVDGSSARNLQLVKCSDATARWKNDGMGGDGLCTVRWPTKEGKTSFGEVPERRNCVKHTGNSLGVWHGEIVIEVGRLSL